MNINSIGNVDNIIIYTTTFYPEGETWKIREQLAERFLKNTFELGIKCVVVDGGSSDLFLNNIKQYKNIFVFIEKSLPMGDSRKFALAKAIEISNNHANTCFLWSEPEKYAFITVFNLSRMKELCEINSPTIVIAKRSTICLDNMQKLQILIESKANERVTELITGKRYDEISLDSRPDYWFGPKMFSHEVARYFLDYSSELNKWDYIIKPVLLAHLDNINISSLLADYNYDANEISHENENTDLKMKRLTQYTQIFAEIGDVYWTKRITEDSYKKLVEKKLYCQLFYEIFMN